MKVKKSFQRKAKKAYELCVKAIEAAGKDGVYDKWKKVFGRPFPGAPVLREAMEALAKSQTWDDTEQFIEELYPVDIKYNLRLDCDVKQNGFREYRLTDLLSKKIPLLARKTLEFEVVYDDVPGDHTIFWKVLNRGDEARGRNNVRGQIVQDSGHRTKTETTLFRGDHVVECYAVKDGVVVAKDRIHVPINENAA